MKLITAGELDNKTFSEISSMFCKLAAKLPHTEPGSIERTNGIASLENLTRALAARQMKGPRF
jgi:hypothetical protein